ncbi:hypothetical protein P7K49_035668 [Saguinus oedipus]|uniref:Uncharacterized protein n=1 Tax=Saguinus oedipus TaxID=9490 RepID=A0ABQ9TP87_SAGOE|nr:hypothetical protein P7K49_035668 [Saguinus oedipus]
MDEVESGRLILGGEGAVELSSNEDRRSQRELGLGEVEDEGASENQSRSASCVASAAETFVPETLGCYRRIPLSMCRGRAQAGGRGSAAQTLLQAVASQSSTPGEPAYRLNPEIPGPWENFNKATPTRFL